MHMDGEVIIMSLTLTCVLMIIILLYYLSKALHYKKYSTASDVWSFGCVMFEIWSLGHKPFEDRTNAEVSSFARWIL